MNEPNDHARIAPTSQFLAVAMGNTTTRFAIMENAAVVTSQSVPTHDRSALHAAMTAARKARSAGAPTVIASVVPRVRDHLRDFAATLDPAPFLTVGEDVKLPMEVRLEHPERVGVDRICCAAGAFEHVGAACVVADFGTALTIDLIGDDGAFLGGTILPGLQTAARALHTDTAQLPLVEITPPDDVIGIDTVSAIRAGVFYGLIGSLREITERIATKIGRWPTLIATGGDAMAISSVCDFVDHVAPDLVFDGIAVALSQHRDRYARSE